MDCLGAKLHFDCRAKGLQFRDRCREEKIPLSYNVTTQSWETTSGFVQAFNTIACTIDEDKAVVQEKCAEVQHQCPYCRFCLVRHKEETCPTAIFHTSAAILMQEEDELRQKIETARNCNLHGTIEYFFFRTTLPFESPAYFSAWSESWKEGKIGTRKRKRISYGGR